MSRKEKKWLDVALKYLYRWATSLGLCQDLSLVSFILNADWLSRHGITFIVCWSSNAKFLSLCLSLLCIDFVSSHENVFLRLVWMKQPYTSPSVFLWWLPGGFYVVARALWHRGSWGGRQVLVIAFRPGCSQITAVVYHLVVVVILGVIWNCHHMI